MTTSRLWPSPTPNEPLGTGSNGRVRSHFRHPCNPRACRPAFAGLAARLLGRAASSVSWSYARPQVHRRQSSEVGGIPPSCCYKSVNVGTRHAASSACTASPCIWAVQVSIGRLRLRRPRLPVLSTMIVAGESHVDGPADRDWQAAWLEELERRRTASERRGTRHRVARGSIPGSALGRCVVHAPSKTLRATLDSNQRPSVPESGTTPRVSAYLQAK